MKASAWMLLVMTGCASKGDLDRARAERDALETQVQELEQQVRQLGAEDKRLRRALAATEQRAVDAEVALRRLRGQALARELGVREGGTLGAVVHTSAGDIRCELWPEIAPVTVRNFVELAEGRREWTDPRTERTRTDPLYPGTTFHRVVPGFMIQGGDPLGTGEGGPGYTFEDEVHPDVRFDERGLLAMANAGPDTNGSQFFVTDGTPRHLDGKHTIFGKCDPEPVRAIMARPLLPDPSGEASKPIDPVRIERIAITRG